MASSISIKTAIPGPVSRSLAERRSKAVSSAVSMLTPVFVGSASGVTVQDVDGNTFLDFAGGIGSTNAGHSAAPVTSALQQQAKHFLHTCFMVAPYEGYVAVAERLNAIAPGLSEKRSFLANTGAEAVENAVKLARAYTGRSGMICFEDGYHGRTYMAMALTSKEKPYKAGFAPFPGEVYRSAYPYCYRAGCTATEHRCCARSEQALEEALFRDVNPHDVAGIIVEPVLGEGGFVVPPKEFLPMLRAVCDRFGILLIVDEVQTGFGRTGRMFACDHEGVEPDLLLTAKSIASGMPLSAVTGKAEIMNHPMVGALGGTFGGNPMACAAALATLDMFQDGLLCHRANEIGAAFQARAQSWADEFDFIGDVRGIGAMQAIELVEDRITKRPASELTKRIQKIACEHGLLLVTAGTYGNVIRLLVPLVVSDAELLEGLDVLGAAMRAAVRERVMA